MLKYIIAFVYLLLSGTSLAGNVRCNKQVDGTRLHAFFCPCKSRLDVTFRTDPGTFAEGEKLDVTIDGVSVGKMTLKTSGAKLTGQLKKNRELPVAVAEGSKVTVGDLTCKMR